MYTSHCAAAWGGERTCFSQPAATRLQTPHRNTYLGRRVFSQVGTRALCLQECLQSQGHRELRSMMSPCKHACGKYQHPIASSIVAKRPSPCSGKGVRRTGGAYLKQTAVLPRSGNEIQPPHSCQHFAHVRQGLHGVTDSDYSSPGEGYSRRK